MEQLRWLEDYLDLAPINKASVWQLSRTLEQLGISEELSPPDDQLPGWLAAFGRSLPGAQFHVVDRNGLLFSLAERSGIGGPYRALLEARATLQLMGNDQDD